MVREEGARTRGADRGSHAGSAARAARSSSSRRRLRS